MPRETPALAAAALALGLVVTPALDPTGIARALAIALVLLLAIRVDLAPARARPATDRDNDRQAGRTPSPGTRPAYATRPRLTRNRTGACSPVPPPSSPDKPPWGGMDTRSAMSVPTTTSPTVSRLTGHEPVLITAAGKTPVAAALEAWDAIRAGHQWRFTGPVPKAFKRQALEQLQAYREIAARADSELNRARYETARGHLTETEYAEQLLA